MVAAWKQEPCLPVVLDKQSVHFIQTYSLEAILGGLAAVTDGQPLVLIPASAFCQ